MPAKVNRALFWALAVSLAAHLALFGSVGDIWFRPVQELEFPIEASLLGPAPEPRQPVASPARPASRPLPPTPVVVPESQPPVAETPESVPESAEVAVPVPVPAPPAPVLPPPAPEPGPPSRPAVRTLPDSLTLRYAVQTGEGDNGFVAGRATYVWQSRNGRYSLTSTLEATGLTALFVSGRIVQVSEGRVDGAGLQPEQYWLQRNERKQDVARFDWTLNQITLEGRGTAALTPGAQDLLSFPFHLAMTASEGEPGFMLGVSNGRKFNQYAFEILGRESLELRGHTLETLHLRGARPRDGELDVWLDLGRTGLPVRVRTLDRKGNVMELRLEGAERGEAGSGG
jgi:hypothetical protein